MTPYIAGPHFSVIVAPMLMCIIAPVVRIVDRERKLHHRKLSRSTLLWIKLSYASLALAVVAWLVDRIICPNELIKIELHAVWHLAIYFTGHLCLTYLKLYYILRHYPKDYTVFNVFPVPHLEIVDDIKK
eukprot:Awhi_evm1s15594